MLDTEDREGRFRCRYLGGGCYIYIRDVIGSPPPFNTLPVLVQVDVYPEALMYS